MKKNSMLVKLPQKGEFSLQAWCNHECKRINNLLNLIEDEFEINMNDHSELRSYILDTSNHIQRLLSYIEDEDGDK